MGNYDVRLTTEVVFDVLPHLIRSGAGVFPVLLSERPEDCWPITMTPSSRVPGTALVIVQRSSSSPPTNTTAVDFLSTYRVEVLLIHCEAGMSRSPGVAAALSRIYYGDDGPWGEYDFPNSLVYQRLVDGHG